MTDNNSRLRRSSIWLPSLFGALFVIGGVLLLSLIVNNLWLVQLDHPDFAALQLDAMMGRASAADLIDAADPILLLLFLLGTILATTGLVMPFIYFINQTVDKQRGMIGRPFHIIVRQAFWVGLWEGVNLWLHMHRTFGIAIGTLIAFLFLLMEGLLLVRIKSQQISTQQRT